MNICLEGPSGNWDWFEADIHEDNLGLDFDEIKSKCGTTNPMVIDIEYEEEPNLEDILKFDGMGWTSINSLIEQAKELKDYDDWDLEKIAIYMRTKDNDLEYAKKNYDNHFYVKTDDSNPTSLAYELIDEDGIDEDTAARYFDFEQLGRDLLIDGYETDEEDEYTVGEEYIDGVYGSVQDYINTVGVENAVRYFDYDGYGRTLNIGWTYDDVTGNWISESRQRKTNKSKLSIKESRSDVKYTGKTWNEFIANLESNSEYEVDSAYRRKYEQWIELIDSDGKIYDAEVTKYYPTGYELYTYNITPSHQYTESWNKSISPDSVKLVMNSAARVTNYDELDAVLSSLLSIDKDLYKKFCDIWRTQKVSAAYLGGEISDALYYMLQDEGIDV